MFAYERSLEICLTENLSLFVNVFRVNCKTNQAEKNVLKSAVCQIQEGV